MTAEPGGISVDLARELARRLGVGIEFVRYEQAGKVVDGLKSKAWDVCFLAIDPMRATDIAFTAPYAVIEGVYMVAHDSPARVNGDVDRAGTRVGVILGSAYDLFLTREIKAATIVRAADAAAVMDLWVAGRLDAVAGVKPQLEADAKRVTGLRLLPQRFMAINQAMGTPRERDAGARYLRAFVDDNEDVGVRRPGLCPQPDRRRRRGTLTRDATRGNGGGDRSPEGSRSRRLQRRRAGTSPT